MSLFLSGSSQAVLGLSLKPSPAFGQGNLLAYNTPSGIFNRFAIRDEQLYRVPRDTVDLEGATFDGRKSENPKSDGQESLPEHWQPHSRPASSWRFYWEETRKHFPTSYQHGASHYFAEGARSPFATVGVLGTAALIAGLFTALPRHRKVMEILFLGALMIFPMKTAMHIFPMMKEAYQEAQYGHQLRAEGQFHHALDELVYEFFFVYLGPLKWAAPMAAVLAMPNQISRILNGEGWLRFLAPVFKRVQLHEGLPVLKQIHSVYQALRHVGGWAENRFLDPVERKLTQWFPRLNLED